jgi:hypothetical protein
VSLQTTFLILEIPDLGSGLETIFAKNLETKGLRKATHLEGLKRGRKKFVAQFVVL